MGIQRQRPVPLERLSRQICQLQDSFEVLAKAATLKEMARLFSALLQKEFTGMEVNLFHLPSGEKEWHVIFGEGAGHFARGDHQPEREFDLTVLNEAERKMRVVQPLADASFLGMVLRNGKDARKWDDDDTLSIRLFSHLFANAYQPLLRRRKEKDLVFSLNHRVLQLNSLIDTGIEVSKLTREGSLHQLALERAAVLTNASRGRLTVSSGGSETERYTFPTSNVDADGSSPVQHIQSSFTYLDHSYVLELFEKESRGSDAIAFDETDQLLLDALARQVHASLENRYLLRQAIEKQKTDQEISVAATIQQKILPKSLPTIDGFDISGINIASKSVGGDYYDCIPLGEGNYALVIADVAGKGIPAGLLVSTFHAFLNAYLESPISLVQLARQLNRAICKASTDEKFITAFLAFLNPTTGVIESLSAGHNPVYLVKNDRTIQELSTGGVAIGMLDMDFPYQTETSIIEKGQSLLLYTDGVTEAIDEQNRLYDNICPLTKFTLGNVSSPAERFIQDLTSDIRRFAGNAPQADDITAMYLRRL